MQIRRKGDIFSVKASLQREILKELALAEPKTKREIMQLVHGHYSNTWKAVDSLVKQGLIQQVRIKEWKNRKYPQFWLTDKGLLACLALNLITSPEKTVWRIKQIYPEKAMLFEYVLRVSPYLNREVFRITYENINRKGKLNVKDLMQILLVQAFSDSDMGKLQKLIETAKEYPEFYAMFKKGFSNVKEAFEKIAEMVLS